MSYQVKVLKKGVSLPDQSVHFVVGDIVTLTDAQYALISPSSFSSNTLQVLSQVPDGGVSRNIFQFGARTSSSDNASLIQSCIDASSAAGGGSVVIPSGVWLTGPLKLRSRVKLIGEGDASQLKLINGANDHMISLYDTNTERTSIENLLLDGNGANQTAGSAVYYDNTGFAASVTWPGLGDPYHYMKSVTIGNAKQDGVQTTGPLGACFFDTVVVRNCDRYGIHIGSPDNQVVNSTVFGSGLQNFMVEGNSVRIQHCKSYLAGRLDATNGAGYYCLGYSRLDLIACESQDNRKDGFTVGGGSQHNIVGCRADRNGLGADSAGFQGDGLNLGNLTNSRIELVSGDRNTGTVMQRWTYNCYGTNSGNVITITCGTGADASKAGIGSFGSTSVGWVLWNGASAAGAFA